MLQHSSDEVPGLTLCKHIARFSFLLAHTGETKYWFCISASPQFRLPPRSTKLYIIINFKIPDCFKLTPTGTACLPVALLHAAKNQDHVYSADLSTVVILQFSFITNGEPKKKNAAVKGKSRAALQMNFLALELCVRWRREGGGARRVSLWLVSYVVQEKGNRL